MIIMTQLHAAQQHHALCCARLALCKTLALRPPGGWTGAGAGGGRVTGGGEEARGGGETVFDPTFGYGM